MPHRLGVFFLLLALAGCGSEEAAPSPDWGQWGRDAAHTGRSPAVGQPLGRVLVDVVYDPLADAVATRAGGVYIHYPTPLVAGDDVFMMFKAGTLEQPTWTQKRLRLEEGGVRERWTYVSDWRPVPGLAWEPVFHPALTSAHLYVPAAGGAVDRVDRETGARLSRIDPFRGAADSFVVGPLTLAPDGAVLYNVLAVDPEDPWRRDARGGWLVRVTPDDRSTAVSYAALVRGAPAADAPCELGFGGAQLPWPPGADARPRTAPCGSQRPGVNVAPAVGADGSVVTVSRAHFNDRYGYVVALDESLAPRWAASLRDRLSDGCGSALLPATGTLGGCRAGARAGVDPATNAPPAGRVVDLSSASPVITPDGGVLYGAFTRYNGARGHLFRFAASGDFVAAWDYGWDVTPSVYSRGSSWSVIVKDNDYGAGSYCDDARFCPPRPEGPYRLAQLSAALEPEWRSEPAPDEWCINAPAVDAEGTVFAVNEDGHLYAIRQGGAVRDRILLARASGAAYTPLAIGGDGRIFALNYGRLFAVGR